MSEGTTLYCGDNCNHTGPHRYPPAVPADPPSPRYIVDRETLIAAYESQAWSSPDQMADMLLDGLALASSPAPAELDVERERLQEAIDSPALQDAIYEDMVASWPHILGEVAPPEHVEQAKAGARRSALRSANAVRTYLLAVSKGQA